MISVLTLLFICCYVMVPVTEHAEKLSQEGGLAYYDAFALAMNDILDEQCRSIAIPKRITTTMRDIWLLHRSPKVVAQ